MAGLRHGPKRYSLGRDATQRWHLQRTQVTQLVEHERITTTYTKAKALQFLALKAFKLGKQAADKKGNSINKLMGILTTRLAVKKMINEIVPKFTNPHEQIVKIVELPRRQSDSARMAYIQYNKNDLQKYEEAAHREKIESGVIPQIGKFNIRILQEELEFFNQKLSDAQSRLESAQLSEETSEVDLKRMQQDVKFFERQIGKVEKDLWIENKNSLDCRRYFRIQ